MVDGLLAFLKDPANQSMLGWLGGGVVVVATGVWAVITFFAKKDGVKADNGSAAIGGDARNSPINITSNGSGKR